MSGKQKQDQNLSSHTLPETPVLIHTPALAPDNANIAQARTDEEEKEKP
jgi:hypothetical protein